MSDDSEQESRIKNFNIKLKKYRRNLKIKNNIHKAWLGVLNKGGYESDRLIANPLRNINITMNMDRLDHKKDLAYYYKRIINYLYQENVGEKSDQHKISLIFNKNLYKSLQENDSFKSDEILTNIHDFVVDDEKRYFKSLRQIALGKFIYSAPFQAFLGLVVLINSIMLALQTDSDLKNRFRLFFVLFECFANAVFLIELLLKWIYGFRVYWFSVWNIFDFLLVVFSLIPLFSDSENTGQYKTGRAFGGIRVVRALRSLRSISILSGLQLIVESILKSVSDMINIVLLMLLTMIMLSLFGNKFFGQTAPAYFKDLETGLMSLFCCATREGLTDLFDEIPIEKPHATFWRFFLVISIVILAFVLTNLIVAVVVTNMEQALKEEEKKRKIKRQQKLVEGHAEICDHQDKDVDNIFAQKLRILKSEEIIQDFPWSIQQQKENSILQDLDLNLVEKYFITLDALEQNQSEYSDLKSNLKQMVKIVSDLTEKHTQLTEKIKRKKRRYPYIRKNTRIDLSNFIKQGDILSNLMDFEKHNVFSTEELYDFKSITKATVDYMDDDVESQASELSVNNTEQVDALNMDIISNDSDTHERNNLTKTTKID